jgi:Ca2+-binding RTX toxin-like protein
LGFDRLGGGGNDTLLGGWESDPLLGNNVDDTVCTREGLADTVSGGAGNDQVQTDAGLDVLLDTPEQLLA